MNLDLLNERVARETDAAQPRVIRRMIDLLFAELETVYAPPSLTGECSCNCPACKAKALKGYRKECSCPYCRARVRYTLIRIKLHHIRRHLRGDHALSWPLGRELEAHYHSNQKHWEDRASDERAVMAGFQTCSEPLISPMAIDVEGNYGRNWMDLIPLPSGGLTV